MRCCEFQVRRVSEKQAQRVLRDPRTVPLIVTGDVYCIAYLILAMKEILCRTSSRQHCEPRWNAAANTTMY